MRHGLYRHGFMLCDRCVWNGACDGFEAGGDCRLEREAFEGVVGSLVEEYGLDGVADRILAERAAMYLIRLARADAYEAWVGVSEGSAAWGSYMVRLDRSLMELLRELAVTRAVRMKMEAGKKLTVGVEELINMFVRRAERRAEAEGRRIRMPRAPIFRGRPVAVEVYRRIREDWRRGVG